MTTLAHAKDALESLPDELLLLIVEAIASDDLQPRTLPAVCLLNRHFYQLALPVLYSNYSREGETPHWDFLLPLLKHQHLAEKVKSISYRRFPLRAATQEIPDEVEEALDASKRLLSQQSFPDDRIDEIGLFGIICRTRNLSSLAVYLEAPRMVSIYPTWLAPVLRAAAGAPLSDTLSFANLHSLNLGGIRLSELQLSALFRLPSLRILEITGLMDHFNSLHWDCKPKSSNVVKLSFDACNLPAEILSSSISSCKRLEELSYTSARFDMSVTPEWVTTVGEAVRAHHATLQSLIISISHDFNQIANYFENWNGSLGPLHTFTNLQNVDYPVLGGLTENKIQDVSFTSDCLPLPTSSKRISLQTLNDNYIICSILNIIKEHIEHYNKLQRIRIRVAEQFCSRAVTKKFMEDYRTIFADLGVDFDYVVNLSPYDEIMLQQWITLYTVDDTLSLPDEIVEMIVSRGHRDLVLRILNTFEGVRAHNIP